MKPLVSVVVPTCDDDLRLEWLLEGLCRQTYRKFEAVVVNDCGPTATERLVSRFRDRVNLRYVYFSRPKTSQRAAATRNEGVRHSAGELILFLDTDMVADPDLVESHAAHYSPSIAWYGFRRHYPMDLVRPFSGNLDYDHLRKRSYPDRRLQAYPRWGRPQFYLHFFGCNYSVPAKLYCDIGGHDERYEGWGGEDIDLGYRIVASGARIYPLWGMGVGTHLDHPRRPVPEGRRHWHCSPSEPLCRNGQPLRRIRAASAAATTGASAIAVASTTLISQQTSNYPC